MKNGNHTRTIDDLEITEYNNDPHPKLKKPVMSVEVEVDVMNAVTQFLKKDTWRAWGMHSLREQGSCILLEGPPGTGKTTIARYVAAKVKRGFKQLNVAVIGGADPGSTERAVKEFFEDCTKRASGQGATIFIDECDHLLGDRSRIEGAGLTWQLGTIEMLMMCMNSYKGLVICATNHQDSLDPALSDRFLSIIRVGIPDRLMRMRLWRMKWPAKFPYQPTMSDLDDFCGTELTGRQIENVIVNVASNAIRTDKKPTRKDFMEYIKREKAKHI